MTNTNQQDSIAPVLGRIPSGVFILTATNGNGHSTGMLTSWVQQAGFEPPSVTVAVNKVRYLKAWLKQHPHLTLNLIGQSQGFLMSHFGKGFEPDENAFENQRTEIGHHGIPRLSDALGALECDVTNHIETGDHFVYVAVITHAYSDASSIAQDKPMVHIRKDGFKY